MSVYPYSFEAEVERFGVGKTRKVWYSVLMLPADLRAELPFDHYPRLRVEGEIADIPIANAFIPTGDGRNYVIVGPEVREGAGVDVGDRVEMRFAVADQDAVDVPEALDAVLSHGGAVQTAWEALTPGKKRALAQHVRSAKTDPTRMRRVDEAVEALLDHGADLRAWRQSRKT